MPRIDEKEILEIEALKQNLAINMKRFEIDRVQWDKEHEIRNKKAFYEAFRLAFYGVAVGLGGTFAIAKTISLLGWVG